MRDESLDGPVSERLDGWLFLLFVVAIVAFMLGAGVQLGGARIPSNPKAAWSLYQETVETERIRHQEALGVPEQGDRP